MKKHTTDKTPKQLGFSDLSNNDPRPLPIIVAERWNFSLQYHISNGKTYFSVQDWIVGLTGTTARKAGDLWRKMKNSDVDFNSAVEKETMGSIQSLNYQASNGKTYQMDFADDRVLA